jgi:ribosomal protein S18 acetylase RimI-like enzyme
MSGSILIRVPRLADAAAIGQMHLQASLETYLDPRLGIDRQWILDHWGVVGEREGTEHREAVIRQARSGSGVLYLSATVDRALAGFVHAARTGGENELLAIYTLARHHGSGVGTALMDEAIAFFAPGKPTTLEVASGNARAIAFYERYGFAAVGGSETLWKGRLPVLLMRRPAHSPS